MPVVVHDANAVDRAVMLEPPLGALKLGQAGGDMVERHFELEADRDGRQRILDRVTAGHLQVQFAQLLLHAVFRIATQHAARASKALEPHIDGRDVHAIARQAIRHQAPCQPRPELHQLGVVGTSDHASVERHFVGELDEGLQQILETPVRLHVLAVDVGHHRNRRIQLQE